MLEISFFISVTFGSVTLILVLVVSQVFFLHFKNSYFWKFSTVDASETLNTLIFNEASRQLFAIIDFMTISEAAICRRSAKQMFWSTFENYWNISLRQFSSWLRFQTEELERATNVQWSVINLHLFSKIYGCFYYHLTQPHYCF